MGAMIHRAASTAAFALVLAACTAGAPATATPPPAAIGPAAPSPATPEAAPSAKPAPSSSVAPLTATPAASSSAEPDSAGLPDDGWSPALAARLARAADALPKGKLVLRPPADEERDRAIRQRFGDRCRLERTCGPLWGIDCDAAVDGPYFYARPRADHIEEITTCGGACMGGRCTNCPPRDHGWTCATY